MENLKLTHKDGETTINVHVPLHQPLDAPLLTFETAGAYLGNTADGVRQILKGGRDNDMELANVLKLALVTISAHRRLIRKDMLLAYLNRKAGIALPPSTVPPLEPA